MRKYLLISNFLAIIFILISNTLVFIPITYNILKDDGGPFGWSYLIIPILFFIHFGLIFTLLSLVKKHNKFKLINIFYAIIILIIYIYFYDMINYKK
uniref:hypothetical protein n=2 Tax=Flavobacterium sp. TaxID=239 RepID=UPI004048EAD0